MVVFPCHVCRTSLSADEGQAGQLVRCPQCLTTLRVPAGKREREPATVGVGPAPAANPAQQRFVPPKPNFTQGTGFRPGGGKRYGFNCGYCSSRLEATESMGGQDGQC